MTYRSPEQRILAHEVLERHDGQDLALGAVEIISAIETTSVEVSHWGRPKKIEVPMENWWAKVNESATAIKNRGLFELSRAELDPTWVQDRIRAGETDEVVTVAGLVKIARDATRRIEQAHRSYQTWLD